MVAGYEGHHTRIHLHEIHHYASFDIDNKASSHLFISRQVGSTFKRSMRLMTSRSAKCHRDLIHRRRSPNDRSVRIVTPTDQSSSILTCHFKEPFAISIHAYLTAVKRPSLVAFPRCFRRHGDQPSATW